MSKSQDASKILHSSLVTYFQEILIFIARVSGRVLAWITGISLYCCRTYAWGLVLTWVILPSVSLCGYMSACTLCKGRRAVCLLKPVMISPELEHNEPRTLDQKNLAWLDQKNNRKDMTAVYKCTRKAMPGWERPVKTTATGKSCHEN